MSDIDCDFGDCDCDCDIDCCCCCCCSDVFSWCCDNCFSCDGDNNNLFCCIICIGSNDGDKHDIHKDRSHHNHSYLPWLCCCDDDDDDFRRRSRAGIYSEQHWLKDKNGEVKKESEKVKKKEEVVAGGSSKHATFATCYSCRGPIDHYHDQDFSPPRNNKHPQDYSSKHYYKCSRCSSINPPSPLVMDPPSIQHFNKFDRENYVGRHGRMY